MSETIFVADIIGDFPIDVEIRGGADPRLQQTFDRIRMLPNVRDVPTHLYESIEKNLYSQLRTDRAKFRLDAIDRAIVRQLQVDGCASLSELSQAAGISPSGARLRRFTQHDAVKIVGTPARRTGPEQLTLGVGIRIRGDLDAALQIVRSLDPEFLAVAIGQFELIATLDANSVDGLIELADRLRASPEIVDIRTRTNLRTSRRSMGAVTA